MNTRKELMQASVDFQMGKFGEMDEPYLSTEWAKMKYMG